MSRQQEKELIDEFDKYYEKAVNAAQEHFEYIKEYVSDEISAYFKTKECYHIVDLVCNLPEVEDLIDFSDIHGKKLEMEIIKKYGGEISSSQPFISAIERGLSECDFAKELRCNLENN